MAKFFYTVGSDPTRGLPCSIFFVFRLAGIVTAYALVHLPVFQHT